MRRLKVYYGIGRVTGVRKKRSIEIYFENTTMGSRQQKVRDAAIKIIAYTRAQTLEEQSDAPYHNRVWHAYSFYIDEKPFNGSLDRVLYQMEREESLSVSKLKVKEMIVAVRKAWMMEYPEYKDPMIPCLFD